MLFSCSSGATVRYLEDVVRAISMPSGGTLQFRYATKYIDPQLVKTIERKKSVLIGRDVILTYLDQSDERRNTGLPPKVVPCRHAIISEITMVGTSVTLVYELRHFVFPKNVIDGKISYNEYQKYVGNQSSEDCPLPIAWKEEKVKQRAKGYWFCEVKEPNIEIVEISEATQSWVKWQELTAE